MSTQAYPLSWPSGRLRTTAENRENSRFRPHSVGEARDEVLREVRLLGGEDIVLSTNIPLRRDGLPYSVQQEPDDPGVAVYFMWDGEQFAMSCDQWTRARDNMRAIARTINALRSIDRWCTSGTVKAAFEGFKALPPSGEDSWRQVLGVDESASLDDVKRAYRQKVKNAHPDLGGNIHDMHRVNAAYDAAQAELDA